MFRWPRVGFFCTDFPFALYFHMRSFFCMFVVLIFVSFFVGSLSVSFALAVSLSLLEQS